MTEISENIKNLRAKSGMSQSDLAARLGKSRSAISQYEAGDIVPRIGVIEDMAAIFNVSKSVIIGESEYSRFPPSLSSDEQKLLKLFRKMDARDRAKYLEMAVVFATASEKDVDR